MTPSLPTPGADLVDRIDALLPQTQCTKCGFAGCRPYAQALADGEAAINRCPPGGRAGIDALAALLERRQLPAQTPVVLAAAGTVPVQVLVDICDLLHARGLHGIDIRALEAH